METYHQPSLIPATACLKVTKVGRDFFHISISLNCSLPWSILYFTHSLLHVAFTQPPVSNSSMLSALKLPSHNLFPFFLTSFLSGKRFACSRALIVFRGMELKRDSSGEDKQ